MLAWLVHGHAALPRRLARFCQSLALREQRFLRSCLGIQLRSGSARAQIRN